MNDLVLLAPFLTSLGVGLMLGLERERRAGTHAGLRTFALVALAGTACALLAQESGASWLLPAAALGLLLMMVAADWQHPPQEDPPDTTTTVALLLCYLFGAMLWHGHVLLTVALALAVTALLYFKAELHDATHRLTRQDIVSFLQFAAITFVVLPVLPDEGYGPYAQLNPYRIWLMVVLTAGISLAGYVALRFAPNARMVPLLGLLGGLISSTATTLAFARRAREEPAQVRIAAAVILIANLVLLVRVGVLAAVVAPQGLDVIAPVLLLGVLAGTAVPLRGWLQLTGSETPLPDVGNPANLRQALAFGLIYAVVLVISAAFHAYAGAAGVYTVAAFSGLGDMDAIAISTFQLLAGGSLTKVEAARAIAIALSANMGFKCAIAAVIGGRALARTVGVNYFAAMAGLAGGLLLTA